MRLGLSIFGIAVILSLPLAIGGEPASPTHFDPQLLVGRWEGTWQNNYANGKVWLTVREVRGTQVFATVYNDVVGSRESYHNRDIAITGTIVGNKFTYDIGGFVFYEFTVAGGRMTGSGGAVVRQK